jgi:hypothetical protein
MFRGIYDNARKGELQNRLRVFENRVPRKIFAPKRDEVSGEDNRRISFMIYT